MFWYVCCPENGSGRPGKWLSFVLVTQTFSPGAILSMVFDGSNDNSEFKM